jgi:hypothetical protein
MSKVVLFRAKPRHVSLVRSRNEALESLIPKLLGILWEMGRFDRHGQVTAIIDADIELGGYILGWGCFGLHVYAPSGLVSCLKVFSAHVGDRSITDPAYFPYWGGRCGILSWKRGPWEDRVITQHAEPRTFAHLMTAGLTRAVQSR